jgi:uncharacterized protein
VTTYLLVDGENIDATLGIHVLGHRPLPEERPRWERIREFAGAVWDAPLKPLFFLNASSGQMPMTFVQALLALDYRPIPLSGSSNEKVVDLGIIRMLEAIAEAPSGDVILASHDGDFAPALSRLLDDGRRVGVLGLTEFVSTELTALDGLSVFDLEDSVGAFTAPLPRVRIIPLEAFDPTRYL